MPSWNSIAVAAETLLIGVGTALSGWAAWKAARKRNEERSNDEADGR